MFVFNPNFIAERAKAEGHSVVSFINYIHTILIMKIYISFDAGLVCGILIYSMDALVAAILFYS